MATSADSADSAAKSKLDDVCSSIDEFVEQAPDYGGMKSKLKELEVQTGYRGAYFVLAITALLPLLLLMLFGSCFVVSIVGFVYPAFASLKAIEGKSKPEKVEWLAYWLVYALFCVVEGPLDFVLSWVPFYFLAKLGFLVWCYHPKSKGASVIFELAKQHLPFLKLGPAESSKAK